MRFLLFLGRLLFRRRARFFVFEWLHPVQT